MHTKDSSGSRIDNGVELVGDDLRLSAGGECKLKVSAVAESHGVNGFVITNGDLILHDLRNVADTERG